MVSTHVQSTDGRKRKRRQEPRGSHWFILYAKGPFIHNEKQMKRDTGRQRSSFIVVIVRFRLFTAVEKFGFWYQIMIIDIWSDYCIIDP